MAEDNYQYQSLPIPQVPPFGGNALNNALSSSPPSPPNIDTANYVPQQGPFGDPPVDGGGGGGAPVPPPITCADDIQANTLSTSAVAFPCDSPTGSISNPGIVLTNEDPTDWLKVQYSDMSLTDDVIIQLNELDVCHLGAPGKRKFVCGDSYAPP